MSIEPDEKVRQDFFINIIEPETLKLLTVVNDFLTARGIQAFVVGGFVRDLLLERRTADIDIALSADALEIAPDLADTLGGKSVILDRDNRVSRIVLVNRQSPASGEQRELDFTTFSSSIEQDLARRDFTVNAMAVNLEQLVRDYHSVWLIDPFNGRDDLNRGIIRSVTETVFESDPARLLRAVRLAAELGFTIDEKTEAQIKNDSSKLASVAGERVREELLRLLAVSHRENLLPCLDKLGLLTVIIPELSQTRGNEQPKEHFWDVFEHSLRTVNAIDFLLRQGNWEYSSEDILITVPWSDVLCRHFAREVSSGSTGRELLKLAALLHDIAKPQTRAIDADGRVRFLGHAGEGAEIVVAILERLRFSTKEIKLVEVIVKHHLRPMQMSQDELPTHRAIYRYFRDTGTAGIDILFFSLADHLATRGPHLNLANWQEHTRIVDYVLTCHSEQESQVLPTKLVDGNDIISIFGVTQGPEVGELLTAVQEARAAGELTTRQEALTYIRESLLTKGK